MADEKTAVLVVGGGVVGLTSSLFLAQHAVRALLVERHPGTSIHPRARGVNGRTMELLRELGLEAAVRKAGEPIAASMGILGGPTLVAAVEAKGEGGRLTKWLRQRMMQGKGSSKSPTAAARITQDLLEPVLLEAARARGVDARFSTELVELEQDSSGVTATILDRTTQVRRTVRADYVIAADGARSPIRSRLGVTQSGAGVLTHQLNLYFRADLSALVRGREFSMCLVENPHLRGLFASVNNRDLWVLHVSYDPEQGQPSPELCVELIREAVGIPALEIELKGAMPWQSTVRVADGFRHGRVFLAGDAAHVMPPWGGFGANTGVQDAHNLAWKLAAVIRGEAGPALLDTYDEERRPVARAVSEIAGKMNDERGLMKGKGGLGALWNLRRAFPYFVVGYGYGSSAIALEQGARPGPGTSGLKGLPGTRAPHVWLSRDGKRISTLDLFGKSFVLLAGPDGRQWSEAARAVAQRLGLRLEVLPLGGRLDDPERRWPRAFGVRSDGAVLVRPDGFVAWRARKAQPAAEETLTRLFGELLSRAPEAAASPGGLSIAAIRGTATT